MKKIFFLAAMLVNFATAFAFRIEYGNNVIISQPVYEDLYLAGGNITINAPIHGDLIIAGGTIIINDTITNDILLAGGNVTFNGFVGDDIRCAGGNIHISKNVVGDVVIAGGEVTIDERVMIGGLIASGGNITIDGNVMGEVKGAFGNLILTGSVEKDIDCRGGKITINGTVSGKSVLAARNIFIERNAVFNGDVRYWNKQGSLDFKQSLRTGKAIYDPSLRIRTGQWYYLGAATVIGLLWYLGMALLMILLVQYLFSATMKKAANTVFDDTLKSLGYGFLFFIAVPIAAVIAFVTVIGVPVGLLLTFSYVALILLATVITSVVAASWFNNRNNYKWGYWRMAFAAFGIFILLKLVSLAPFVGWLISILSACIAFGSILLNINWKRPQKSIAAVQQFNE
jgi:cytoskeletal protein CcmA (bactofilin family)